MPSRSSRAGAIGSALRVEPRPGLPGQCAGASSTPCPWTVSVNVRVLRLAAREAKSLLAAGARQALLRRFVHHDSKVAVPRECAGSATARTSCALEFDPQDRPLVTLGGVQFACRHRGEGIVSRHPRPAEWHKRRRICARSAISMPLLRLSREPCNNPVADCR